MNAYLFVAKIVFACEHQAAYETAIASKKFFDQPNGEQHPVSVTEIVCRHASIAVIGIVLRHHYMCITSNIEFKSFSLLEQSFASAAC
jgi:hypothetical protein